MQRSALPLALALTSGAAALVYETVWLRWFRVLFGSTAYAASATLAAFFLGLALGSWLFARVAARSGRPLALYARIELGAAFTALIVPLVIDGYDALYPRLHGALTDWPAALVVAKFALAFAAMLPTTLLLGGTLPLLVAAFVRPESDLGREGGLLYTANTLGAAAGVFLAGLWLPERLGLGATYGIGVALSVAVAAAAFLRGRLAPSTPPPYGIAASATRAPAFLLATAAASGFGTLAFEVLLIHLLSLVIHSSVYSVAAVLLVVLLALAMAAALVAAIPRRVSAHGMLVVALGLQAAILFALPHLIFEGTFGAQVAVPGTAANGLRYAALFGGPALLVGGLVFPLTLRLASGGSPGARIGGLLAANTAGGIVGSLVASFVLLNHAGAWASLAFLGVAYAAATLGIPGTPGARAWRLAILVIVGAALTGVTSNPLDLPALVPEEGAHLLAVEEDAHGTVGVVEESDGNRWLRLGNHYGLSSSRGSPRQERWGHLSLLHHPNPKRVLFIGSGTGGTASASVLHPVQEISLVEVVPSVHALAARYFAPYNRRVHRDPRTRLISEDGRNHVRASGEHYDVIVSDLFVPSRPGTGSLYSRDHFEAIRDHLTDEGVFVQWLPIYQLAEADFRIVASTFLEIFPEAELWRGSFSALNPTAGLVGTRGPAPTPGDLQQRLRDLARYGVRDRWLESPDGLWMFYIGPLAGIGPRFTSGPIQRDDRPVFEFVAGRATPMDHREFALRTWPDVTSQLAAATARDDPRRTGRQRAAIRAGAAMSEANLLATSGLEGGRRQGLDRMRRAVPAKLLHPPDWTLGELWPARPDEPDALRGPTASPRPSVEPSGRP
jgi:spermidine synthase